MTEESDTNTSAIDCELLSSMDDSLNDSYSSDTMNRVRIIDDLDYLEKDLGEVFEAGNIIPFTYDPEDFDNCKLNSELKKII
jgi:hypothetical protein